MDFFEVLIILAFIFLPLLEGIFKRRRAGQEEDAPIRTPPAPERERVGQGAGAASAGGPSGTARIPDEEVDAGPAADMIPADLWEVLTGERRSTPPSEEPSWQDDEAPWVQTPAEELPDEFDGGDDEPSPWAREYDDVQDLQDLEPETKEPVSPHHGFPQVVSLETPPPPPEVRHRRFHEKYDAPPLPPAPVAAGLASDLRSGLRGQGLRRTVILAEILGPPKGML